MKDRIEATKVLLGAIGVFFLLIFLQIWYIITGNE
tara:strand:- start:991 stop:1095 length:105 start_codon:yes stop_codon:yes gene_type:complete